MVNLEIWLSILGYLLNFQSCGVYPYRPKQTAICMSYDICGYLCRVWWMRMITNGSEWVRGEGIPRRITFIWCMKCVYHMACYSGLMGRLWWFIVAVNGTSSFSGLFVSFVRVVSFLKIYARFTKYSRLAHVFICWFGKPICSAELYRLYLVFQRKVYRDNIKKNIIKHYFFLITWVVFICKLLHRQKIYITYVSSFPFLKQRANRLADIEGNNIIDEKTLRAKSLRAKTLSDKTFSAKHIMGKRYYGQSICDTMKHIHFYLLACFKRTNSIWSFRSNHIFILASLCP